VSPLSAQRPRPDRVFGRISRKNVGEVYRYALALTCDRAQANDVTRTTLASARRAYVKAGVRPARPRAWLIAIAFDVCRRLGEPGSDPATPPAEGPASSFGCAESELAVSLRLDGRLSREAERRLREHLRECPPCATFDRRQHAQRRDLTRLAFVSVPPSLVGELGETW
jgi:DNA-directed RNA polymerase specialized sigma24 family protein